MRREDWPEVGRRLAETAKTLERAGAENIALCCNTLLGINQLREVTVQGSELGLTRLRELQRRA
jgi:aspartate/glutamate racemase